MNVVVCVGYLDKHTRFFHKIYKSTQKNLRVRFVIHSIYPSGWLKKLIYLKRGYWIPAQAWWVSQRKKNTYKSIIKGKELYRNIDFSSLLKYHIKNSPKTNIEYLQIQSLAYIDIYEAQVKKLKPSLFLLLGDSRLSIECCVAVAKKHNIPIYYLEQGPNNTTIFNSQGVNAKWPIKSIPEIPKKANKEIKLPLLKTTYLRNPIFRGIDFLTHYVLNGMYVYPPDLHQKKHGIRNKISKSIIKPNYQLDKDQSIFFLALQVDSDVNMIYHSPYFNNSFELLSSVYHSLPANAKLIVREHPKQKGRYCNELYRFIENNQIILDNKTPLQQLLELANVVVVNNSTVGIEALLKHKVLVVLGKAYYAFDEICLRINNKNELKDILFKAQNKTVNKLAITGFLHNLFNNHLIEGDIASKKPIAAHRIARIITKLLS